MSTNAAIGYGIIFSVETDAGSGTYTTIGEITSLTPPASATDAVDVTHHASPAGIREFIPGLTDPGEVTIAMNFKGSSASDTFIRAWQSQREARACKITFPASLGADDWAFSAFPTEYSIEAPIDDKASASLTCKVTGAHTVT